MDIHAPKQLTDTLEPSYDVAGFTKHVGRFNWLNVTKKCATTRPAVRVARSLASGKRLNRNWKGLKEGVHWHGENTDTSKMGIPLILPEYFPVGGNAIPATTSLSVSISEGTVNMETQRFGRMYQSSSFQSGYLNTSSERVMEMVQPTTGNCQLRTGGWVSTPYI